MTNTGQPEIGSYVDVGEIKTNLARHFHVYAPGMAGFGFSEKPAEAGYGMAGWVDQLTGFLDALDIDRRTARLWPVRPQEPDRMGSRLQRPARAVPRPGRQETRRRHCG